ncbi:FAD-binding oxidoreductase [Metallosphaera tengchongensis]|uniref:FAD-binding oxidoreductase n=1 Tax=Metallosphaera tengchongensis TaxID=1532350 RepID=A0A6N0P0Y8_9CREN|nr:FAD-binding oxidoreductase [Metallosphaera tengchongensis]QKR01061.1 FAD-binding oxidoreductase [Metallosphaera tengchongensis]
MFIKKLEKEFGNKFIIDDRTITEFSTSPYLVSPVLSKMGSRVLGVVSASDEQDVINTVKFCDENRIPLLARGAGTSTIGQVLPITPSIALDMRKLKGEMEYDKSLRISPGVKVLDALAYLRKRGKELQVYPSSFYISTLGGYIAGGDVGIGSYQYGYHFHNDGVKSVRVVGPSGTYVLSGIETLAVSQAAGVTGVITEAELAVVDLEDWKDQLIRFRDIEDVVALLKDLERYRQKIRRITVEDKDALSTVARDRVTAGDWNVIISSTQNFGEEVELRFLDELAFAAIYVTMSKLTKFQQYFYEVRLLSLGSFLRVVKQVKRALGSKVLIHGDVMTLRGETIVYTVFMSERSNFDLIDSIMLKEGIPFEIHSLEVNDRVDEDFRLELMKKYKQKVDPHNILNPGKLRL